MTKKFAITVASSCLFLTFGQMLPALSDSGANAQKPANNTKDNVAVPRKIAGLFISTFIGMPICFIRRTIHAEIDGTHGMVGDTNKKCYLIPAGSFWMPFAIGVGAMEAPGCSIKNSFRNFDKPFSKDQFSLGEIPDNN